MSTQHTSQLTDSRVRGWVGDALAAVVVLLGAGLFGGFALFSPALPFPGAGGGPGGGPGGPPLGGTGALVSAGLGWGVVTAVILAGAMFLRRHWPLPVFVFSTVVLCISLLWGAPALGAGVAATIAAYAFAFRSERRQMLWWVGGSVAVIVILAIAIEQGSGLDWRVAQIGSAMLIAAVLGDSAQSRQAVLQASIERAEQAEQGRELEVHRRVVDERLQIARDLHDTVAHRISVINLQAGAAAGFVANDPERVQQSLGTIRESARAALHEIGQLLRYLRDDTGTRDNTAQLGVTGIETNRQRLGSVADIGDLIAGLEAAGLRVLVHHTGPVDRLPEREGAVVYRVVQEALTNALKHGSGDEVVLEIDATGNAVIITVSNRVPAEARTTSATEGSGLGLIGVRERVAALQGTVHTKISGGQHVLRAEFPILTGGAV